MPSRIPLSFILLLPLLLGGCSQKTPAADPLENLQAIALYEDEGGELPAFSWPDTRDGLFDNQRLKGKWTLLYFGYTHCPDICPTALSKLAAALRRIGDGSDLNRLQVVFVTIDPDRDDMATMKTYVRYFHPALIGARDDIERIRPLTRALGIQHYITKSLDGSLYNVAHSGDIAVIDPDGKHIGMIQTPMDSKAIAHDLSQLLQTR